jgi:hypothetical protein
MSTLTRPAKPSTLDHYTSPQAYHLLSHQVDEIADVAEIFHTEMGTNRISGQAGYHEGHYDAQSTVGLNSPARMRVKRRSSSLPSSQELLPLPTISPSSSRSDFRAFDDYRLAFLVAHKSFWVFSYLALNLTLTLYNKYVLVSFPYPYTLTAIHSLFASIGGRALLRRNFYRPKPLALVDYAALVLFSILYSLNIAVSNISLELVTVPVSTRSNVISSYPKLVF